MAGVAAGYHQEDRQRREGRGQGFDPVAFAMRALQVLRPRGLTVAVREGRWQLRVETGRQWGAGPDARWAMVSIPPDATREDVALAISHLAGLEANSLAVAVLMTQLAEP